PVAQGGAGGEAEGSAVRQLPAVRRGLRLLAAQRAPDVRGGGRRRLPPGARGAPDELDRARQGQRRQLISLLPPRGAGHSAGAGVSLGVVTRAQRSVWVPISTTNSGGMLKWRSAGVAL